MRWICLCFLLAISATGLSAQGFGGSAEIVTVYSQNEKFYLRSIPYDNEFPSLRGKTSVYRTGDLNPLYVFDRGFDSVDNHSNNLILSNDGEIIFYLLPWYSEDDTEGLKSATVYKKGRIIKSFTEAEITGCDYKKERCELVYSNFKEVVDEKGGAWGMAAYNKVFKPGINEQERFLSGFSIFAFDDTVYLTDSKKNTHSFSLRDGTRIASEPFEKIFGEIKNKGRFTKVKLEFFSAPMGLKFPNMKNGQSAKQNLAAHLGMKLVDIYSKTDQQYKHYFVKINCYILRDGSVEIDDVTSYDGLSTDKIKEFFQKNKFNSSLIPKSLDKWYVENQFFYFRNSDARVARQEKQQQIIEKQNAYQKRVTLESINGKYIPKDLGESLVELDKILGEIDKNEMKALPKRDDMIQYHHGLGMWMRNNWSLWGGSRLQKYFIDKGIRHPDDMSSVVLFYYYDRLKGDKDSWKEWDKNPKSPFK